MRDAEPSSPPPPHPTACFTGLARGYAAHRPRYPAVVAEAALAGLAPPVRALDVGCGTGISSRLLATAGAVVIGVDPNRDMLARAEQDPDPVTARIRYRSATATATGLDQASVDLVLCAQSFHWLEPELALAEFHRVLAGGGRLALLWNVRDGDDPLGRGYEAVVRCAMTDAARRGRIVPPSRAYPLERSDRFTDVRRSRSPNPQTLDRAGFIGRARSASYFPPGGTLRTELEATLARLFDEHEENGAVTLRQHADLTLAESVCRR